MSCRIKITIEACIDTALNMIMVEQNPKFTENLEKARKEQSKAKCLKYLDQLLGQVKLLSSNLLLTKKHYHRK